MNKTIAAATLLSLATLAAPALAVDFTGPHAPGNWTVSNTGTLVGGSPTLGTATFTTTQLVITGANGAGPGGDAAACTGGVYQTLGPCQVQATIAVPGTYSFSWAYLSSDSTGAAGDLFGVIVDGSRTVLSDIGGAPSQSGTATYTAGSSFGWFVNCTDCIGGSARATVSQFAYTQAIPEPSTYALLLVGGVALGGLLARRKKTGST